MSACAAYGTKRIKSMASPPVIRTDSIIKTLHYQDVGIHIRSIA